MTVIQKRWSVWTLVLLMSILHAGTASAKPEPLDLQKMIDQAKPGDAIELAPGTYAGPVKINKPLTIQATHNGTVILQNDDGTDPAITVNADQTTIAGLRISDEIGKESATVLVTGNQATLKDMQIVTGSDGIAVRDANEGVISGIKIDWAADGVRMADKGNGIDLFNAHGWQISNNTIRDMHDGIYMEYSDNAVVSRNTIERSRYGVHCMYTVGTVIKENEGKMNVTGAMVMTATKVMVVGNTFSKQSENVNSQGILLYDAHLITVQDNTVDGNRVGLYVEQSSNNKLMNNRVSYNFIGIQLLEANDNPIESNQFVGNVADAQARGSENNELTANYWDGFQGIDTDGDGKSNIKYEINPFFQGLTKKRPAFQLFFHSPGMNFLEELYQTDKALWTKDVSPLMAPPDSSLHGEGKNDGILTGLTGLGLLGCSALIIFRMRRRSE
ncbi:nitrous oxide reductase family maturation protein NosD [Paenibacillus sp. NPDC058071]|uniref:right-handed parallel beta-helix repeat-containing protein n=1 Tax=Paenibacillus sp. NPDC058071 TaxID=3346326 RepID=UPI0036DCAD1F